jgi:CRP/FNR family cyclic AMP-dependent transcriptional regulator
MLTYPAPVQERRERLRLLCERGAARRIERGVVFVREGDLTHSLYIIQSGQVQVFSTDEEYQREVWYGVHGAGELIGEVALDGEPRIASVRAVSDVQCVEVPRAEVLRFVSEYPAFGLDLFADLVARVRAARESLRSMVFLDTYARLRNLLERQTQPPPAAMQHALGVVKLTHRDIATRIGCSREMVSKLLKEAADKGHLSVTRGEILILTRLPERW